MCNKFTGKCLYFQKKISTERQVKGITPYMPLAKDREDIRKEFLKTNANPTLK